MDRNGIDHYARRLEQRNPFSATAIDDAFRFASLRTSSSPLLEPWARLSLGPEANGTPPTTVHKAIGVKEEFEKNADSVDGASDLSSSDSDDSLDDRRLQAQGSADDDGSRQPLHVQASQPFKLPNQGMARTSNQSTYVMSPGVGRASTTYHKPGETGPWSGLGAAVPPVYEHGNIDVNDSMPQIPVNLSNNVREHPWALLLGRRPMLVEAAHYTISRDAAWGGIDGGHLEETEPEGRQREVGQLDEKWSQEGELGERQVPPLPEGWIAKFDASAQQNYYIHLPTQATQWKFPTGTTQGLKARQLGEPRLEEEHFYERPPAPLPEGWIRHIEPNTRHYYYIHLPTQWMQWESPTGPTTIALDSTPRYARGISSMTQDNGSHSSSTVPEDLRDQQRAVWLQLLQTDPEIAQTLLQSGIFPDGPPEILRNAINTLHLDRPSQSKHILQDYQLQLMLLEHQNKRRLLMARQAGDRRNDAASILDQFDFGQGLPARTPSKRLRG